jgi:hypothetical protein
MRKRKGESNKKQLNVENSLKRLNVHLHKAAKRRENEIFLHAVRRRGAKNQVFSIIMTWGSKYLT